VLAFKSDPNQRGINDYTPLHMAVSEHNLRAVDLLLKAGAAPCLRTRIDNCETPRELAEKVGLRGCRDAHRAGGAIGIVREGVCYDAVAIAFMSPIMRKGFS
jgi:ankyrin repeat protein